ncbi:hypothetical protein HYX10_06580 [Candidatus Woesearchaeota archaeon]|nr:hypothetical protein [Candidatus Woesearchaeota archaeon]
MSQLTCSAERYLRSTGFVGSAVFSAYKRARFLCDLLRFELSWILKGSAISNVNSFERWIYSQNGEDGIIEAIFRQIKAANRFFVEFGVEDGSQCNTRLLKEKGWRGLMMDAANNPEERGIKKEFITAENINNLFKKYRVPAEFDLLGIDLDGNDYWVWKAVKGYSPRVVVIEYNAGFKLNESKTIKYDSKYVWDGSHYFGASLLALARLGKEKGYALVGCDSNGVNAFFVRDDLLAGNFRPQPLHKLYRPFRHGKIINGVRIAQPLSNKEFVEV